jgi:hypothetical protein
MIRPLVELTASAREVHEPSALVVVASTRRLVKICLRDRYLIVVSICNRENSRIRENCLSPKSPGDRNSLGVKYLGHLWSARHIGCSSTSCATRLSIGYVYTPIYPLFDPCPVESTLTGGIGDLVTITISDREGVHGHRTTSSRFSMLRQQRRADPGEMLSKRCW